MTLIFVRHGLSRGNELRVAQGWSDYPLSDRGRQQAEAVAARLALMDASALYSSDLKRASETAEIVAARSGLTVVPREGLRERRFGEGEGLTWKQITERWGEDLRVGTGVVPGEERTAAFRERVGREVDLLAERHSEDVAVCVTHGGTISVVVAHVLGLPPDEYPAVHTDNCSLTTIELQRGQHVISCQNDRCHLDGVAG
jgi:broad specificity phosphatase PhoE